MDSVIVPAHRPGVSLPQTTTVPSACTRCRRPIEPGNVWNICASCTTRASQPSVAGSSRLTAGYPNHHLSTARITSASKSRCAACRAPLRGSCHQASLCPSCQARHAAVINGKQVPRARPTPVTTNPYPIAKSARPTVYPPSALPGLASPPVGLPSLPTTRSIAEAALPPALVSILPPTLPSALSPALPSANPPLCNIANPVPGRSLLPAVPPTLSTGSSPASILRNTTNPANATSGTHPRPQGSGDLLRVCMRFGCGAYLLPHIPGDTCEVCTRAGFVRPPSSALVQTRPMSKRVEQTCSPLLESVNPVRTSRAREDELGGEARTDTEGADDDNEVELMYPDDVPLADSASASVAQTEHLKPVEDEHDELELVYPEDAAETARPSLPKKSPKVPLPPTTLRELFQGTLQTIPTLQNLTWVSDKARPRPCPSQDCTDIVPAQSGLQRCVKCTTAEWKRRPLASTDTEPPRRQNVMSMMTTSPMEEREVATILDDMSDVEEEHEVPPPSSLPNKDSSHEYGQSPIPGWDSDLTELSSDSDTESTLDESDPKPIQSRGEPSGFKIRIPLLVTHLPPGISLQKCANKKCNIALPRDHRWKTCDPCRDYQKMYQRLRLENKRRSLLGLETLDPPELSWRRLRSLSPDLDLEIPDMAAPLTPETSRSCSTKRCSNRIPLPEVYRWKTCVRCRAKARRKARRKKRNALFDMSDASCDEVVPRFPAYQNQGQLVASFGMQLKGFVEGQIMYYRAMLREEQDGRESWTLDKLPMIFVFAAEYSVVTGQRGQAACHTGDERRPEGPELDPTKDAEAMRQEVASVVVELGCVLHAKFQPGEAFAIDKGGILMRFACPLELITQLRPLANGNGSGTASAGGIGDSGVLGGPGSSSTPVTDSEASPRRDERDRDKGKDVSDPHPSPPFVPLVKMLTGELEVVVIPDESHRLFRGRRTVVRYRMVG